MVSKCLGDMYDSNSQMLASGYYSHSQYQNHSHFASLRALNSGPVGRFVSHFRPCDDTPENSCFQIVACL